LKPLTETGRATIVRPYPVLVLVITDRNPHIGRVRTHPYAEAVYRVVELRGGAFGVEVKIPEASPTTVSSFETEADAEAWIARNKQRVLEQSEPRNPFRRSRPRI
jgi:hypothetical protein